MVTDRHKDNTFIKPQLVADFHVRSDIILIRFGIAILERS